MGITIKDIAKALGVSPGTISKALNNKPDIGAELKEKIRAAAVELGYIPNPIARRLVTNKSNTIGVFILDRYELSLRENYGFQFLDGIIKESDLHHYDILLFSTTNDLEYQKSYIDLCLERRVEGAIFIGLRSDDSYIEDIMNSPIPVSVIDAEAIGPNVSMVASDNRAGATAAVDYLWQLGHRKIGILNGCAGAFVSRERYEGFVQYLKERDAFNEKYVYYGDFSRESGAAAAEVIMSCADRPTALFATNDQMALGALKAFKRKGYRIPEDISLIGFDNISNSEDCDPALSTIGQNATEIGKEAIRLLLARIRQEINGTARFIETELFIRDSCAPLKNKLRRSAVYGQ